jgi:hypothetical protein
MGHDMKNIILGSLILLVYAGCILGPDPRQVYRKYLDKFQGTDIDVINKGVFVYPEA